MFPKGADIIRSLGMRKHRTKNLQELILSIIMSRIVNYNNFIIYIIKSITDNLRNKLLRILKAGAGGSGSDKKGRQCYQ